MKPWDELLDLYAVFAFVTISLKNVSRKLVRDKYRNFLTDEVSTQHPGGKVAVVSGKT
jgi:hypothetical protein